MKYQKISTFIREANPEKNKFELSKSQIEALHTAADICLAVIAVGGVVAISVIAPNLLSALGKLASLKNPGRQYSRKDKELKVSKAFYYLRKKNYISFKPEGSSLKVFLTTLGQKKFDGLAFKVLQVPKGPKWNGRWWQVAADIPTKDYRWAADLFRNKLKQMKFYPLQRTLWFYPFDPRAEIEFIVSNYGISNFVTVMEMSGLDKEDENKIKEHFIGTGVL
jgi:hypothetical protein